MDAPFDPSDFDAAVAVHLVGEALRDEGVARVYGDTSLGAEVSARVGLTERVEVGVEAGYRRLGGARVSAGGTSGAATWLWYVPVSLVVGPRLDVGALELAAGVGPTGVLCAEQAGSDPDVGYRGAKVGVLVQGEARLDPRAFSRSLHGKDTGLDVELVARAGWRTTVRPVSESCGGEPCGLDLGALRLSIGVALVLP